MKLTHNLSRHEFACKCKCGFDTIDFELIRAIQSACDHFNTSVRINSGCRCVDHNAQVGGHIRSKHIDGKAADIVLKGVSPSNVAAYFERNYPNKYGIGIYDTFTHIDVQPKRKRWNG